MTAQPSVAFYDRHTIPQLGFGVFLTPPEDTSRAVKEALLAGYRHIDTAAAYKNEAGVGESVRSSGIPREEIFVTTKLWNEDQGFDSTLKAFDKSLQQLGLEYIDLYLIHWPSPQRDLYVDTWRAFVRLKEEGHVRSIGVSNFSIEHINRIVDATGVLPAINQVELHPAFQQRALHEGLAELGVVTESWSPLGRGKLLTDPTIASIAKKYGRTPAQIIIRWHLDNGFVVIPKSVTPSRILENFDVFGFKLGADDLAAIEKLDSADGRIGPDPVTATF